MKFQYDSYDAVGLAELVSKKEVSPRELLDAAIDKIETSNPALNAVVLKHFDQARETIANGVPPGRFAGVPFLLKDLDLALAGTPLTHGSALFRDNVPQHDSTLVARYKAAGLVILGKTNSAELGLNFATEPTLYGPTHNPLDASLSPGGSSGGSSAAVAAGMVPMAHATDGGGSIRQPSALMGLFGLKPSRGRTPSGPNDSEIFFGISVSHAITRTVRDSAALLDATLGFEPGALHWLPNPEEPYENCAMRDPRSLRIALQLEPFNGAMVEPDILAAVRDVADLCAALGHQIVEDRPTVSAPDLDNWLKLLSGAFTAARIEEYGRSRKINNPIEFLQEPSRDHVRSAMARPAQDVVAALDGVRSVGRLYSRFFDRYDVILSPVTATQKLPLGWLSEPGLDVGGRATRHAPFTAPYNAAGVPAMSIPYSKAGYPIGIQFAAALGREDTLFSLAGQIERARPWIEH